MIISYKHNFIFIRTRKTASSTIEDLLRESLGPDDVFVSSSALRNSQTKSPVNFGGPEHKRVSAHMKADEIINMVPERFWKESFKFTSERHPYEKAVSLAYFNFGKRKKKGKKIKHEFDEFLDKIVQGGSYRGFAHYAIDGKVVVDDFIRHESLQADLKRIGERLGIELPTEMPRKKTSFRADTRKARDILSEAQRRIVFEKCREEFEFLGYEP